MHIDKYEREYAVAVQAVREAAVLCRQVQDELSSGVLSKEDRSPVTIADFGSQALICRRLREAFPDDPIIAEEDASVLRQADEGRLLDRVVQEVQVVREAADREQVCSWIDYGSSTVYSDRFWTLDPIDGTKGFLRGDQYAIALALVVEGNVEVAALACPNLPLGDASNAARGGAYVAIRGEGAWWVSLDGDDTPQPVRVSDCRETAQARFCEPFESSHSSHGDAAAVADILGITADPVRLDSQAKYAVVGRGDADIYLRLPTRPGYVEKIWDHAAGALFIEEAGGKVTDLKGNPLEFHHGQGLEKNRGIVATNGLLHEEVLQALQKVLAPEA